MYRFFIFLTLFISFLPSVGWTASTHSLGLDGAVLSLYWGIPFIGILLSIAVLPLWIPEIWHKYYGKIAAFWALSLLLPVVFVYGYEVALYEFLHIVLLDYIPFIILLGTLFIVSGGIYVKGSFVGTPQMNTGFLIIGTLLASFMGTTGAAMVLIRPLLRANSSRRHQVHTVVFFIFLVANIGGSLTPLGDPPLFLGFLEGVTFGWTMEHMFFPMLFMVVPLLTIYFLLDRWYYTKEMKNKSGEDLSWSSNGQEKFNVVGKFNILLIGGVLLTVLMQGIWQPRTTVQIYHVDLPLQLIVANGILLLITAISLYFTAWNTRVQNEFTWFPIVEVGRLFAGIFVTIIPVIAILKAGEEGVLSFIIASVSHEGQHVNSMYFWVTGVLSSFLDNAPTYLVFFNTAGGNAQELMDVFPETLMAISTGAVFMGANTYIGNAPNFMVRSIAQEKGVNMPSFYGFMGWSTVVLGPLFLLFTLFFLI